MFLNGIKSPTTNPVLFLGEGNFSFSASVVKMIGFVDSCQDQTSKSHIWTSCFESDSSKLELNEKNKEAIAAKEENKDFLKSRGCCVLDSLNAQHFKTDSRLSGNKFSKIIFMFPHIGAVIYFVFVLG